jgi:hypothetical protein
MLNAVKANQRGGSALQFLRRFGHTDTGVVSTTSFQKLCRGPLKLSDAVLPAAALAHLADVFRREDSSGSGASNQLTVGAMAAAAERGPAAFYRHAVRTLERQRPPAP